MKISIEDTVKTIFFVGLGCILSLYLMSIEEPPVGGWNAVYCEVEGCPPSSEESLEDGTFQVNVDPSCPATYRVKVGTWWSGQWFWPTTETWFLKEGTCQIWQN